MYGYEIRSRVKERFSFEPATVTAYVVLYKMRKEGLVAVKIKKSKTGRPDRKYYYLTPKGIELLTEAKATVDKIYSKVFDKIGN